MYRVRARAYSTIVSRGGATARKSNGQSSEAVSPLKFPSLGRPSRVERAAAEKRQQEREQQQRLMTQQGATLQNYNSELVGCIEEVWTRQASPRRKPARARLDFF